MVFSQSPGITHKVEVLSPSFSHAFGDVENAAYLKLGAAFHGCCNRGDWRREERGLRVEDADRRVSDRGMVRVKERMEIILPIR